MRLKLELKDKDEKLKELLAMKLGEIKSEQLEQLKMAIVKQYAEASIQKQHQLTSWHQQIEHLHDELKEKEIELDINRSDNRLLCEKVEALESEIEQHNHQPQST